MAKKRQTPEQIIPKLREAEVALARGATIGQACKKSRRPRTAPQKMASSVRLCTGMSRIAFNNGGRDGT